MRSLHALIRFAPFALGSLLLTPVAQAQKMLGQGLSTFGYVGYLNLNKLYSFGDGTVIEDAASPIYGGQAGLGITPSVTLMGSYSVFPVTTLKVRQPGGKAFGDAFSLDAVAWDASVQIRRPFWHEAAFNPLLQLGGGQMTLRVAPGAQTDRPDERVVPMATAALGFDLQPVNALGFRFLVKDHYTTARWSNSLDPRFNATAIERPSHNLAFHVGITLGF
jgi:hypothetical protein